MKELKERYKKDLKGLDKKYRAELENYIRKQLEKLDEGEQVKFSSPILIAGGEYADWINHVNEDGSLIVYNNEDCDSSGIAYDDAKIYGHSFEVLFEVSNYIDCYLEEKTPPKMIDVLKELYEFSSTNHPSGFSYNAKRHNKILNKVEKIIKINVGKSK